MQDAATTGKWLFVTVMGRHAGHLTLGIAGATRATLAVTAEEFGTAAISLEHVADILDGAIIKRRALGQGHGAALFAEGLLEDLDRDSLGSVGRDGYGNVRLEELELARLVKTRVAVSLGARGLTVPIVAKDIGYELRCAPPGVSISSTAGAWGTVLSGFCSTPAPRPC